MQTIRFQRSMRNKHLWIIKRRCHGVDRPTTFYADSDMSTGLKAVLRLETIYKSVIKVIRSMTLQWIFVTKFGTNACHHTLRNISAGLFALWFLNMVFWWFFENFEFLSWKKFWCPNGLLISDFFYEFTYHRRRRALRISRNRRFLPHVVYSTFWLKVVYRCPARTMMLIYVRRAGLLPAR